MATEQAGQNNATVQKDRKNMVQRDRTGGTEGLYTEGEVRTITIQIGKGRTLLVC